MSEANIDIERLKVDRGYWDSEAPEGATHYRPSGPPNVICFVQVVGRQSRSSEVQANGLLRHPRSRPSQRPSHDGLRPRDNECGGCVMDEKKDLRHLCGAKVHQEGIDHFSIPDLVDELESFISQFSTHDMIAQAYMQGQIDQGIDPSWSGATAYAKSVATTPQPPAVPDGWREQIERAVGLAAVFDDGGDGADSESARSVVNILNELLDTPPPRPGAITWTTYALRVGRKEE